MSTAMQQARSSDSCRRHDILSWHLCSDDIHLPEKIMLQNVLSCIISDILGGPSHRFIGTVERSLLSDAWRVQKRKPDRVEIYYLI